MTVSDAAPLQSYHIVHNDPSLLHQVLNSPACAWLACAVPHAFVQDLPCLILAAAKKTGVEGHDLLLNLDNRITADCRVCSVDAHIELNVCIATVRIMADTQSLLKNCRCHGRRPKASNLA